MPALVALALVATVWVALHAYELIWWREARARRARSVCRHPRPDRGTRRLFTLRIADTEVDESAESGEQRDYVVPPSSAADLAPSAWSHPTSSDRRSSLQVGEPAFSLLLRAMSSGVDSP